MKKFRNLPSIFTLLSGFICSVIMILHKYPLNEFMLILVSVMVGFYIVGLLVRIVLDKIFQKEEEKKEELRRQQEEEEQAMQAENESEEENLAEKQEES